MKNIHRNTQKFQTFLIYLFRLFFLELPLPEYTPYVFVSPVAVERETLKRAVAAFEQKKRAGGTAR